MIQVIDLTLFSFFTFNYRDSKISVKGGYQRLACAHVHGHGQLGDHAFNCLDIVDYSEQTIRIGLKCQ